MLDLAAWRWPASAPTVGRTTAEAGESDGYGGPFARRTADGNRSAMFFNDLLDCGQS
jgi:hypothetical protein